MISQEGILFVRHAKPVALPHVDSTMWRLTPEGRRATRALAGCFDVPADVALVSSEELKALETAEELGTVHGIEVTIDDVHEVRRPWRSGDEEYKALARRYLGGEPIADWEPRQAVVERMSAAIDRVRARAPFAIVVTHGLALTTYLASVLGEHDAIPFWEGLAMPDAWHFGPQLTLTRVADPALGQSSPR